MSSVRDLYLHTAKGRHMAAETLTVEADGIVGDITRGTDRPQVCLCDAAVLDALAERTGLCQRRFCPNVATEGLAYGRLTLGQPLTVGTAAFAVARVGKACFPACELFSEREACGLRTGCAFLTVVQAGEIRRGDRILV